MARTRCSLSVADRRGARCWSRVRSAGGQVGGRILGIFLLRMPEEVQQQVFSHEAFERKLCKVTAPDHEDDLFAGLRDA